MLIEKLETVNITTKQARDDADVLIIETAIEESKRRRTAVIIGEDIDLLNGCGSRCGCRKLGLQCTLACGQCNGQACLNASPYQSDLDKDSTFDPEILEDLETNILDDENDDNELEIFERPGETMIKKKKIMTQVLLIIKVFVKPPYI
ncbi:hypothetical protein ILUMI_03438 [Ignelater luminosus]|uniref:Uncharacterized protein n=1 Tax=Ignelater luminosus TaxID=2038154 RepID=A0A8K0DGC0_IGNLU|nr:hypothetical protein ILUMI_03438 [Ignelater luminosus]